MQGKEIVTTFIILPCTEQGPVAIRNISTRLYLFFGSVSALLIAGVCFVYLFFQIQIKRMDELDKTKERIRTSQVDFKIQVQEWKNLLIRSRSPAQFVEQRKKFTDQSAKVRAELNDFLALKDIPVEVRKKAESLISDLTGLEARYLDALSQYEVGNMNSISIVDDAVRGADREPTRKFDDLTNEVIQLQKEEFEAASLKLIVMFFLVSALQIGAGLLFLFFTVRGVSRFVGKMAEGMESAGKENDLTFRLDENAGELSPLAKGFNRLMEGIHAAINTLHDQSRSLGKTASVLNTSAEKFGDSAQTQASISEEIAASIEELSGVSVGIAGDAGEQAEDLKNLLDQIRSILANGDSIGESLDRVWKRSEIVTQEAGRAEKQLEAMKSSMEQMAEGTKNITGMANLIDDVANRANLLALNAAIEASRAGEAGRGFSVVADSIGALALQTQNGVRTMNENVKSNTDDIQITLENLKASADVMTAIMQAVHGISDDLRAVAAMMQSQRSMNRAAEERAKTVNALAANIAMAASEQKAALEEMSSATASISQMSQGTAHSAKELNLSAEELNSSAARTQKQASVFRI